MTLRPRKVGTVVERVDEVASTMDAIREMDGLDKDGAVLIAHRQTGGRGRKGRTWHSPEGGLYMSVLLKPRVEPDHLGLVPLWTGLAVARAVSKWDVEPHLSWPNDVLVGTKKLGGVLVEGSLSGEKVDRVVLGVGVNVNNVIFPAGVPGTSLRQELGKAQDLDAVASAVMERLTEAYDAFLDEPGAFLEDYERLCATVGQPVACETSTGRVHGEALGIGEDGELLVRTEDHDVLHLREGDVVHVEVEPAGDAAGTDADDGTKGDREGEGDGDAAGPEGEDQAGGPSP